MANSTEDLQRAGCPYPRRDGGTCGEPTTSSGFCKDHYRVKAGVYRRLRGGKTVYEAHGRGKRVDEEGKVVPWPVARTGATVKEAEAALEAAIGDTRRPVSERKDVTARKVSLRDYFETFMRNTPLKPKSELGYRGDFSNHIEPVLGNLLVGSISVETVKDWRAWLRAKGLADQSLKRIDRLLHNVLEDAVEDGRLSTNPAQKRRQKSGGESGTRKPGKDFVFLDQEQAWRLALAIQPTNYGALVLTMRATGIRMGEASALRVRNIDLEGLTLTVEANAPLVNGKRVLGSPKTAGSYRTIHLHPNLAPILRAHLESFSDPNDPEAWVFTNQRGNPVRSDDFGRALRVAAKVAGIPAPKPKDFRDMQAKILEDQGASEREKAAVLGHTRLATTEVYGGKADPARLRALAAGQPLPSPD